MDPRELDARIGQIEAYLEAEHEREWAIAEDEAHEELREFIDSHPELRENPELAGAVIERVDELAESAGDYEPAALPYMLEQAYEAIRGPVNDEPLPPGGEQYTVPEPTYDEKISERVLSEGGNPGDYGDRARAELADAGASDNPSIFYPD